MSKKKDKDTAISPDKVVALYDYTPSDDYIQLPDGEQCANPDVSVQLSFARGEKLEVVSRTLHWWLICRKSSGDEGYAPSILLAPLCDASSTGYVISVW